MMHGMCTASLVLAISLAIPAKSADTARETELGKTLAAELDRRFQPVRDEFVAGYVFELAGRIAASTSLPFPLQIKLLQTDEVVANALPGGHLVLSSRLVSNTSGEFELARILAHQIAHVASRHGLGPGGSGTPVVFVGGEAGMCTRFDRGPNVLPASFLRTSRGWEEEADRLSEEYLRKAGFTADEPGGTGFAEAKRRLAVSAPGPRKQEPPTLRTPEPK